MKKFIIELLMRMASTFYKSTKYNAEKRRVNLGCGLHVKDGWTNIDGSLNSLLGSRYFKFINKILYNLTGSSSYYTFKEYDDILRKKKINYYDLRNGVPFENNSVDIIFCSHFLEHLNKDDAKIFLKDCFRALDSGGLIRILVPNLDKAIEMYKTEGADKMQDLFFYTSKFNDFSAHKYNYNFLTLSQRLRDIGFDKIVQRSHQAGECPDIDFLDVYPDHSLYVEARK